MRPQKPFSVGTTERLEKLLALTSSLDEYRRIQSIYFRSRYGFSASEIAKMVGLRLQTVRNIHSAYLKNGEEVLHLKGKGGRYHFNLTSEEEGRFLAAFEVDGELGDIVEVGRLHRTYEVKIGRKVPKSTIYRLLHRQGWRKLAPRGKPPEGDEQAIGQFKKTSHGS
jgi:transposase